jgi:hypothetical protein
MYLFKINLLNFKFYKKMLRLTFLILFIKSMTGKEVKEDS